MRPVSETSAEILFHKICMCSPTTLSKRRCLQHPQSQRNTFLANLEDENARPGTLCERPLSLVLPNDSAHIACSRDRSLPVPVAGHSRHPCMVESTLGYWEPASAEWRICPTSFELRRRTGDGRLRRRACDAMGLPLSLGQPPIANRPGSTRDLGRSYGWFGCRDHRWPALSHRTCRRFLATCAG